MNNKKQYLIPFILVTSLFFLWAFLHNLNPILIPHLKKACQLSDTQSAYIDSAVYLGYFLMALPAGWFMHKYGYKNGILLGLGLYTVGALMFYPAAGSRSYAMFLFALFVIASGATFLETVANPYITKLGDPATSEQRLNFAQSFNGVGAFLAPIVGGQVILSGIEKTQSELQGMSPDQLNQYLLSEAATVKLPYLIMAGIVFLVAMFFLVSHIPEIKENDNISEQHSFSTKVFRHTHVFWAVIAQFFYVGAQVCVGSFFIRLSKFLIGMNEKNAAFLWGSIAMVGFMVGRFVGTWLMKYISPARLLSIYSLINICLLAIALTTQGQVAIYAVAAVPFFMSIMFPTIFALGIKGLGEESKIASSFLVMAIFGGAIFPILMGLISDYTGSIQKAYIIPLLCFGVVWFFGRFKYKITLPT
ncbi:MAG: L-fucose:H+ symporter permease [Saprospiraceae bacterium]|nr:L-fucose:H+ symporter permease [Saprospiraceae bacterium]